MNIIACEKTHRKIEIYPSASAKVCVPLNIYFVLKHNLDKCFKF